MLVAWRSRKSENSLIQKLDPRTWLKELHYAPRDYAVIRLGVAIFITCCVLRWGFGIGEFFVPDFFTKALVG